MLRSSTFCVLQWFHTVLTAVWTPQPLQESTGGQHSLGPTPAAFARSIISPSRPNGHNPQRCSQGFKMTVLERHIPPVPLGSRFLQIQNVQIRSTVECHDSMQREASTGSRTLPMPSPRDEMMHNWRCPMALPMCVYIYTERERIYIYREREIYTYIESYINIEYIV